MTLNASADERRKPATTSNPDAYLEYLEGARASLLRIVETDIQPAAYSLRSRARDRFLVFAEP